MAIEARNSSSETRLQDSRRCGGATRRGSLRRAGPGASVLDLRRRSRVRACRPIPDRERGAVPVAGSPLFTALDVELDGTADPSRLESLSSSGARLWLRALFRTTPPIAENLESLESELEELARLVRDAAVASGCEAVWQPGEDRPGPADLAFLIKERRWPSRGPRWMRSSLPARWRPIRSFWARSTKRKLRPIWISSPWRRAQSLQSAIAALSELDPGKPLVLDALPWPATAAETLVRVADASSEGIAVTFFDLAQTPEVRSRRPRSTGARVQRQSGLRPLLQRRHPMGQAWSFVREDLDLRVVAVPPDPQGVFELTSPTPSFATPTLVDLAGGEDRPCLTLPGTHRD